MSFFRKCKCSLSKITALLSALILMGIPAFAGEANLKVPAIQGENFNLLIIGIVVSVLGLIWGLIAYNQIKGIKAHKSMTDIGNTIFETCKTYLIQQGKFLIVLEVLIAVCIAFYFGFLQEMSVKNVLIILAASVIGILGS